MTRSHRLFALITACVLGPTLSGCRDSRSQVSATDEGCDSCAVKLRLAASLGSAADSSGIDILSSPSRDSSGRVLVGPMMGLYEFALFDSSGQFVRAVGVHGHGPGEFDNIQRVAFTRGDSVVVLDTRLTLLSPSLGFVRTVALPADVMPTELLVLQDGSVVVNSHSAYGRAFTLFDANFRKIGSFGPTMVGAKEAQPSDLIYHMTRDKSGGFWAARQDREPLLYHFDSLGRQMDSMVLPLIWYRPWPSTPSRHQDDFTSTRPPPRISGIWLDPDGRMWITGIVADTHWKPDLLAQLLSHSSEHSLPPPSELAKLYDTFIEVVDVSTGTSFARRRIDDIMAFSSDGSLWSFGEGPSGDLTILLHKFVLDTVQAESLRPRDRSARSSS